MYALSDQQKTFLTEDFLRHVLVVAVSSAEDSAKWNNQLQALAEELEWKFGKIASKEYRALGINTALSPQIDLCTEPRWSRFGGSFGEHSGLSAELAEAYCDGFQTSEGEKRLKTDGDTKVSMPW